MYIKWSFDLGKWELALRDTEMERLCEKLDVAFTPDSKLDMKDSIEKALNSENPVPPVAANPYATHEMHWDRRGGGYCTDSVARPGDNNHHSCGEPLNSPIHGGTFDMRTLPNVEKS